MQRFTLLFILSLLLPVIIQAAKNDYNVNKLTNDDGLSNSSINTIFQDAGGLMWFGTWDGLNMFNGREFKVFKPDPSDKNAICNNIIRQIIEESPATLWIATDQGLNRYNTQTNKFDAFFVNNNSQHIYAEKSFHIAKNSANTIFVYINDIGLFYFDKQKDDFVRFNTISVNNLDKMFFDQDDNLWLFGKDKQLHKLIFKKGIAIKPQTDKMVTFKLLRDIVTVCYTPSQGVLWLQTASELIYSYHIAEGELVRRNIALLPSTQLNDVIFKNNYYLLGTNNGLYQYTLFDSQLKLILPSVAVLSLFSGTQDIIWVGTDNFGITTLSPLQYKFNNYSSQNIPGFESGAIRAFYLDYNGFLWVGTKGNGLYKMRKEIDSEKIKIISRYTIKNGLLNNSVFTIQKGNEQEFWIGSDGRGLNYFNPISQKIETLFVPEKIDKVTNISSVYSILMTNNNILWIGTSGQGLYRLEIDRTTKPYSVLSAKQYTYIKDNQSCLSSNIIYSIIQANDSILWLGTRGGGINLFNINKETFNHLRFSADDPNSLSSNDVICLHKDKDGTLWVGTSIGLNKLLSYDGNNAVFQRYTEKTGLPNNTIHGIQEDVEGNIWISTNKGIVKLIENESDVKLISYYKRDGLQNNEFSDGAAYSAHGENLYFGGISGFNIFNPQQIKQRDYIPSLIISSFKIFNQETNINERITISKGNKFLKLRYNENFIGFNFQAIDYLNNENCEYEYMLSGFDSDWVSNGNSGVVTYTNIKPGKYTLLISYTNGDKVWINSPFRLDIVIMPPFWQTTLAYILYAVIVLIAAYLIYHWIKKRIESNRAILIERLERKEQENIHEAKLRFFTNIAHEFYTPITLIYGPCEKILEKSSENGHITKYVNIILSNAKRMKHLITELMEFRKIDTGHVKINPEKINVSALIDSININFSEIAEENSINLSIEKPESEIFWITDNDALEKVLFNIVSNAFKYTPQNGDITVSVSSQENIIFEVTNTGKGIKPENIDKIFNRFQILDDFENQMEAGNSGRNGIGLALTQSLVKLLNGTIKVESEVNKYAKFIIELPELNLVSELPKKEEQASISSLHPIIPTQIPAGKDGEPLILIVDDEKDIRELLKDTLCEKFSNIIEASNGIEALQLMKTKRPNLIICDIMMPKMDGISFAKELKTNVFTNHLPIIFLSAKDTVEDKIQALESGSDVYITKPFRPKHVLTAVENILIKHKLIQEYYHSSANSYELLEDGNLIHVEDKEFLLKIIDYVEDNIEEEDLSPETISNEMGIGKMSFYRRVKSSLDQTPTEFIKRIKLNKATHLLISTNLTVLEIMYQVGFNNKSYFYNEFKKLYNNTPKEYRDKHKVV